MMTALRSLLYVPASRPKMLARAPALGADCIVVDLEDGVSEADKERARDGVRRLREAERWPGEAPWMVRVNHWSSPAHGADLRLVEEVRPPWVLFPKTESTERIRQTAERVADGGSRVALMIETARGVSRVRELAGAHASVGLLILGSADLRLSLGCAADPERRGEHHAMAELLLAARIHGCQAIDSVYFRFRDESGLRRHAGIARGLGFDGKSCIHPSQIAPIHEVFRSNEEELRWARAVQECWREQDGDNRGVVVVDGEMIEALHLRIAERILANA